MNKVKMPTSDRYQDYLIGALKERSHAAAYLTAHLEEKDPEPELLQLALSNVAEALGESNISSDSAKKYLEKLDDLLSKRGSAAIYSLGKWLNVLGLKLTVTVMEDSASYGDEE